MPRQAKLSRKAQGKKAQVEEHRFKRSKSYISIKEDEEYFSNEDLISYPIQDNNKSSNPEPWEYLEEIMSASRSTPHETPRVNVGIAVLLQPEDLQRLINSVVTFTIQQRTATATTTTAAVPAQTIASMKDLKFAEIKSYSGKPDELEDFINNLKLILSIKDNIYDTSAKKIAYALSLLTIGNASLWKKQYIQENFAQGQALLDTWAEFKAKLSDSFKDTGRADDSLKWLYSTKQGNKSIKEFNTLFRIHGQKAGLSFADTIGNPPVPNPNQIMLKHVYQGAISPKISSQIILNGAPDFINGWMTKAAEVDALLQRTNLLFAKGFQSTKKAWKPRIPYQNSSYNQGEPMDINHISHNSRPNKQKGKQRIPNALFKQRKNNGACFKCGSQDHWGSEHPRNKPWIYTTTRMNGQEPQLNPNKPKNSQPKKRFNPQ